MLGTLTLNFDQSVFSRKLRHYFTDSAPITVDILVKAEGVVIKDVDSGKEVEYAYFPNKSIKEMLHDVIDLCEAQLYPRVDIESVETRVLSVEEKKQYAIQGLNLEDIEEKAKVKRIHSLIIARVSYPSMTMVLRSKDKSEKYLVYFHQPLIKVMKELKSRTSVARYEFIKANATIKDISKDTIKYDEVQSDID